MYKTLGMAVLLLSTLALSPNSKSAAVPSIPTLPLIVAKGMIAAINLSERGLPCGPPKRSSAVRMCRLARIAAIIPSTLFRPSSIVGHRGRNLTQRLRWVTSLSLSCSPFVRLLSEVAGSDDRLPSRVALGEARWGGTEGAAEVQTSEVALGGWHVGNGREDEQLMGFLGSRAGDGYRKS